MRRPGPLLSSTMEDRSPNRWQHGSLPLPINSGALNRRHFDLRSLGRPHEEDPSQEPATETRREQLPRIASASSRTRRLALPGLRQQVEIKLHDYAGPDRIDCLSLDGARLSHELISVGKPESPKRARQETRSGWFRPLCTIG